MKILFTGGGTLGSVAPLLAVAEKLAGQDLLWAGTRKGPEKILVKENNIKFHWIFVPKLRRYFDLRNFFIPISLLISIIWSFVFLLVAKPKVVVTAGGFTGVPLVWMAYLLKIPCLLHNQDIRWSLANRLTAPLVKVITLSLPDTVPDRFISKAIFTGNPIRSNILNGYKKKGLSLCGFDDRKPAVLIFGGGTGARFLNELVYESLPGLLTKYNVIHLTGKDKGENIQKQGYCRMEFACQEMGDLYAVADVVITRAGMSALSELVCLEKNVITIPIPHSHQEDNARYFGQRGLAEILEQTGLNSEKFITTIDVTFNQLGLVQERQEKIKLLIKKDAAETVAKLILDIQNIM